MRYDEAIGFLLDLRRFSTSPGVGATRDLLAHLGDPQESFASVQVAGSNGKGSTARMVDAVCQAAGRRTGLYTSPHLGTIRERVRVDGRTVTESAVVEFVETVRPYLIERAADGDPLTFFEVTTALALWYFERQGVDVAVLEVGLGGEYDATSAVDPVAAAVTNVSLEHTDVLGDTIEAVARTKGAVAPADAPLVTAASGEARAVLREVAGDVVTVGGDGTGDARGGRGDADGAADAADDAPDVTVVYGGPVTDVESRVTVVGDGWAVETRVPLLGAYQARNAGVAAVLARQVLGSDVATEATIARGLRSAHWPGRFEIVARDPLVVLDGAHNPGACEAVVATLDEFDYDDLHLAFGAMHDKDVRGMAAAFADAASVTTCRPAVDRAESPEVLAATFRDAGVDDVRVGGTVPDALAAVRERAGPDDCVLAVGSLYLVAEARAPFVRLHRPLAIEDVADATAALERAHVPAATVERTAPAAVHRTVHTRLDARAAVAVRAAFARHGGDCALSGDGVPAAGAGAAADAGGEPVDVVLTGTEAGFAALVDDLTGAADGLDAIGTELADTLGVADGAGPVRGGAGGSGSGASTTDHPWESEPGVMGVVNVTPDSFHDGGEYVDVDDAVARARELVEAGAAVVDVGGESTRPGADPVPVDEEIDRVVPVIEAIADLDVSISVDTRKAAVGRAALDAGADVLNDVTGLADPEMRFLAADRGVPVIVMHSIDAPVVADKPVPYDDVVRDVIAELRERVFLAEKAGIPRRNVIVDPGVGFGKTARESFELLGRLGEFRALGCPILVGHSRKSMFEAIDRSPGERLPATVAATALAVRNGADLVRVHDVAENVAAVRTALATDDPARLD